MGRFTARLFLCLLVGAGCRSAAPREAPHPTEPIVPLKPVVVPVAAREAARAGLAEKPDDGSVLGACLKPAAFNDAQALTVAPTVDPGATREEGATTTGVR